MAVSCPQWWQAPIYFTGSVILAVMAISASLHLLPNDDSSSPTKPINYQLYSNASRALRNSGFNTFATILQINPEIFLSSPNTTIFAIKDSVLTNANLTPSYWQQLLQYHTSPLKLSMNDLLNKSQGTCFRTHYHKKNVAITKIDQKERLVEINHALVSDPDIFLQETMSIHGVAQSFSPLNFDYIQSPICDSHSNLVSGGFTESKNILEWTRVIRLLSSKGFVSFAIGLNSVLDGILEDYVNMSSTTIFAPPDFAFVASSSLLLDRIVRFHILPQRLMYTQLVSLPDKARLRTLAPGQVLEITRQAVNSTQEFSINGVHIVAPDISSSKKFVVHGLSQAFRDVRAS